MHNAKASWLPGQLTRTLWALLTTLLVVSAWAPQLLALPSIATPVTDDAHVLTLAERDFIATRLLAHQNATGVQMAVVIVATTAGTPIDDYALQLAEQWGGGDRDRDDGVVYVLAIKDRQMRLEVGYGLEDRIPDGAARTLIDDTRPLLRGERYSDAILAVIDGVARRTSDMTPTTVLPKRRPPLVQIRSNYALTWCVGAIVALLVTLLMQRRRERRAKTGGNRKPGRNSHVESPYYLRLLPDFALAVLVGGSLAFVLSNGGPSWLTYQAIVASAALGVLVAVGRYRTARRSGFPGGIICTFALVGFVILPWLAEFQGQTSLEHAAARHLVLFLILMLMSWLVSKSSSSSAYSSSSSAYSSSSSAYSWGYSASGSSSSSTSSSSSSSSYGGGGGSFGGGGASSSW